MPPPTPSLADYRLQCMFPFQTIDIDHAGSVCVRDVYLPCDKLFKCYFLLLTCAANQTVHIELKAVFHSVKIFAHTGFLVLKIPRGKI